MRFSISLLFLFFVFLQQGCQEDRTQTNLQFMPDMADGPVAKPYRSYVKPPEGSIAYQAEIYPKTAAEAARIMVNPLKLETEKLAYHLSEGKKIFNINCTPCHGMTGKGDGTVPGRDNYPKPPDFTFGERYKSEADGFYYHTIVFGKDKVPGYSYTPEEEPKGIMPGYGHAITSTTERWQLVMYIRQLQGFYGNESK